MIIEIQDLEINLTLYRQQIPHLLYGTVDVEFKTDSDGDSWIESLEIDELTAVDRYDDGHQFTIDAKGSNFPNGFIEDLKSKILAKKEDEFLENYEQEQHDNSYGGDFDKQNYYQEKYGDYDAIL